MKDSLVISLLTVIHLAAGFALNLIVANLFGLGGELDAYYASNTINAVLVVVTTTSLNYAIVPILLKEHQRGQEDALYALSNSIFNILLLLFIALAVLQFLFSATIIRVLFPGLPGHTFAQAVRLFEIQAFLSVITVLNGVLLALMYVADRLYRTVIYAIAGTCVQLGLVLGGYRYFGVFALVVGLAGSQLTQFILLGWQFRTRYRLAIDTDERLKKCVKNVIPLALMSTLSRSELILDRFLSSLLTAGSIALLQYGSLFVMSLTTLINKGLSLVTLRKFSLLTHESDEDAHDVIRILKQVTMIIIPLGAAVVAFGYDFLGLVLVSKAISPDDILALYRVIVCFTGVLIVGCAASIITNAYYANHLAVFVARLSLSTLVAGLILKLVLFQYLGILGLALASSARYLANFLLQLHFYGKKIWPISVLDYGRYVLKVCVLTAGTFLPVVLLRPLLPPGWPYLLVGLMLASIVHVILVRQFDPGEFHYLSRQLNELRRKRHT